MPHPRCVTFRTHFKKLSVPAAALVDALSDIPQSEPLRQVPDGQRLRSKSDVPVSRGRRVKKTSAGSGGRTRAPVLDRPRSGLSTLISQVGSPPDRGGGSIRPSPRSSTRRTSCSRRSTREPWSS